MTDNLKGFPGAFSSPNPFTAAVLSVQRSEEVKKIYKLSKFLYLFMVCLSSSVFFKYLSKCTSSWLLLPCPIFTILLLSCSPHFYFTIIQVLTFICGDIQFYPVFRLHICVPFVGNSGIFLGPLAYSSKWSEVKFEEINRQETEGRARRASSEDCNSLRFITHSLYVTQSKGEGKKLLSHDTRNKQVQLPLYISKHLLTMH